MYQMVMSFLGDNKNLLIDIAGFKENYLLLEEKTKEIEKEKEKQYQYHKGRALEKKRRKAELLTLMAEMSTRLSLFARFTNNNQLLVNCRFTPWKLSRITQVELPIYGDMLFDLSEKYIKELGSYGITPETQKKFREASNSYYEKISEPRLNDTLSSTATKNMAAAFRDADEALRYIDLTAQIIKLTDPDFYSGYSFRRKQLKAGSVKMAIRAQATGKSDHKPIRNVTFIFELKNSVKNKSKNGYKLIKKTKELGGFYIMHIPPGDYEITVSKTGYKEQKIPQYINDQELLKLKVEMELIEG